MKKVTTKTSRRNDTGMRAEYDFTRGTSGKHYRAMQAGYKITIHQADGTAIVKEVQPKEGVIVLAPDVRKYLPGFGIRERSLTFVDQAHSRETSSDYERSGGKLGNS